MNSEKIIVFTFLFLSYATGIFARSDLNLSLTLQIRTPEKGIIEPLRFRAVITNTGDTDYYDLAPWPVRGDMLVEFRGPGIPEWKILEVPYLNRYSTQVRIGKLDNLTLRAGESKTADLVALYDSTLSYQKEYICYYFNKYGEYTIRAKYEPQKGMKILSNEDTFSVVPYEGADATAYEWLKNKSVPHFMYEMSLVFGPTNIYTDEDALQLIERFPETRFIPWAKLYLGKCCIYSFCHNKQKKEAPDFEKAARLAKELVTSEDPDIQKGVNEIFEAVNRTRPPEKHLKMTRSYVPLPDLPLSVSLRVRFDKIGLIDPLRFRMIFMNTGNTDLNQLVPWDDRRFISSEYRGPSDPEWKPLDVPHLRSIPVKTHRIHRFSLKAGEAKILDLISLYDLNLSIRNKKASYYFDRYGEYRIRVKYGQGKGDVIISNEAAFQVIPYEGPDAAAYEWLREKTVPVYLYDMRRSPDELGVLKYEYASELIERFPESRFAEWVKLYLGRCYIFGLFGTEEENRNSDYDRAAELARGISNSRDPDIRRGAYVILSMIKRMRLSEKPGKKK